MKKLKKLLVALLAATLMVSALPLSASAAAIENEVMPLWDNANHISYGISFQDGDYGYADSYVLGKFGVTNISIDTYIYCLINGDWVYVTETHGSVQSNSLNTECTFSATYGYTYRADYTFTITKNGVDEIIEKSDTQTYS